MRSFDRVLRYWFPTLALAVFASGALAGENPFDDLSSGSAVASEERYYGPEAYLTENRLVEYVAQSRSFLTRNPDSPQAAEIASDLLMAGTVLRDPDTQQWARTRLLFDYPRSFAARYAVASFADERSCRAFLKSLTASLKDDASPANCQRLSQAMAISLAAWGPALISDDTFVLECALISHVAANNSLHELCRAHLTRCEKPAQRIAKIAFGEDAPRDKVLQLHKVAAGGMAAVYERHFYHQLTAEDRDDPAMLRLAVENCLRSIEFEKALPLIERALASERDPQLLYWQGLCLATASRTDEARQAISSLQREFPESPWVNPAKKLEQDLADLDESLETHAKELFALVEALRRGGLEQFESRSEFRLNGGMPIGIYAHFVFPANRAEVVLHKQGKLLLAFRVTDGSSHVYFDGEPAILEYRQAPAMPVPNGHLERTEDGKYHLRFSASTNSTETGALSQARNSLLDSPVLSSPELFAEWLRYTLLHFGTFPEPVERTETASVLRWATPEIDAPAIRTVELSVNRNEKRVRILDSEGDGKWEFRYGPAESFKLDPPEWPDLPTVRHDKMDATTWSRLFALISQLLEEGAAEGAKQ